MRTYYYGQSYYMASEAVRGYTADKASVSGIIRKDTVEDVVYTINQHRLTVFYYIVGTTTQVAPTVNRTLDYGAAYSVTSPGVDGYETMTTVVTGTMGDTDKVIVVFYTPDEQPSDSTVVIDDPTVPLGLGAVTVNIGDSVD